jgi:hypothetical protein
MTTKKERREYNLPFIDSLKSGFRDYVPIIRINLALLEKFGNFVD